MDLNREKWQKIVEGKGKDLRGGKALGGKGGKGSEQGEGGKKRGERSKEGEALRGGKASGGKGGKDLNRERGETILGRKGGGRS